MMIKGVTLFMLLLFGIASAQTDVVTTTAMIADVVEEVGGEHVIVTSMMGPGTDPHIYQAAPSDIQALQRADLILYNGMLLEGQLGEVLERFGELKPVLAVVETAMTAELVKMDSSEHGTVDPHVWMDARLFSRVAHGVAEVLAGMDGDNAAEFRKNAEEYAGRLDVLHAWITAAVASIPEAQRVMVTAHDAFGYYGAAYGIDVAGIQGLSTETEAAVADIRATVDLVVQASLPAIFVESTVNPRTVQAVIEAAHNRGHEVSVGGELYSDAMGAADAMEGTLIGMLRHNTIIITEALGGTVPEWPDELSAWAEEWNVE